MIEPSKEFPVLKELPARKNVSFVARVVCRMFPFLVRMWLVRKRLQINEHIFPNLMRDVNKCQNRLELESLLGKPKYVISGEGYFESFSPDNKRMVPDIVEIYVIGRCRVDLWFKNNFLEEITGLEELWPWDIVEYAEFAELRKKILNSIVLYKSVADQKEKEFLNQQMTLDTFRLFLERYFPMHEIKCDELKISGVFDLIKTSGNYSKLSDLKKALQKTEKAYKAYTREVESRSALNELAVACAFIHPEMRKIFRGSIIGSRIIILLEKYEHLVKK